MKITPKQVREELLKVEDAEFMKSADISDLDIPEIIYSLKELINFEMWDCTIDYESVTQLMYFSDKLGKMVIWEYEFTDCFEKPIEFVQWIVKTHNEIDAFELSITITK